jgi:hypothetical protein
MQRAGRAGREVCRVYDFQLFLDSDFNTGQRILLPVVHRRGFQLYGCISGTRNSALQPHVKYVAAEIRRAGHGGPRSYG